MPTDPDAASGATTSKAVAEEQKCGASPDIPTDKDDVPVVAQEPPKSDEHVGEKLDQADGPSSTPAMEVIETDKDVADGPADGGTINAHKDSVVHDTHVPSQPTPPCTPERRTTTAAAACLSPLSPLGASQRYLGSLEIYVFILIHCWCYICFLLNM